MKNSKIRFIRNLGIMGMVIGMFLLPTPTYAATFTVNTTNDLDDGACTAAHCSLREAVNEANANPGPDIITFNISGTGPHTIILDSNLSIDDGGTTIDGTTEPDYAGAPVVVLESGDPSIASIAIMLMSGDNVVRGLSIVGFDAPTSGFSGGILLGSGGNLIEENYIGFYPAGIVNGNNAGVFSGPFGPQNPNSILNNVISGNVTGIKLVTSGHAIHGNLIGLDPTGSNVMGNAVGVSVHGFNLSDGWAGNEPLVIGGSGFGQKNVISGNSYGISLSDASDVIVQGNYIGTDVSGGSAVGNLVGIQLWGTSGVVIGGVMPGEGNIISGNTEGGVFMVYDPNDSQVLGNTIGLDVNGYPLGNGTGVHVRGNGNQIGGPNPGEGNVISGNTASGIVVVDGTNNIIAGNFIGEDAFGNPVGNGGDGSILIDASNNEISENLIAHNVDDGVRVWGGIGNLVSQNLIYQNDTFGVSVWHGGGHTISLNSMYDNGSIGINLGVSPGDPYPHRVTVNDGPNDVDIGPNDLLNYPVFTNITTTLVEGKACDGCTVEVFLSDNDPSGHGEGETLLVSGIASGPATGTNFSFPIPPGQLDICDEITATATDSSGNTSEFSENTHSTGGFCLVKGAIINVGIVLVVGIVFGIGGFVVRKRVPWGVGGFFVGIILGGGILVLGSVLGRGLASGFSPEADGYPPMEHILYTPQIPSEVLFPSELQDAEDALLQPTVTSSPQPTPTATTPPKAVPTKAQPTATTPPKATDTKGPKVSGANASPNPALTTSPVTVSAAISDGSGVAKALVYIKTGKGGYQKVGRMKSGGGNNYFLNIGTLTTAGTYAFRILAEDTLGNANCSTGNLDACPGGSFVVNIP